MYSTNKVIGIIMSIVEKLADKRRRDILQNTTYMLDGIHRNYPFLADVNQVHVHYIIF